MSKLTFATSSTESGYCFVILDGEQVINREFGLPTRDAAEQLARMQIRDIELTRKHECR